MNEEVIKVNKKYLRILIMFVFLLCIIIGCSTADRNEKNYFMCRQRIIDYSKTIDSKSPDYTEKLRGKTLEIFPIYGFQNISEFQEAINKYENKTEKNTENEALFNIMKQIVGDTKEAEQTLNTEIKDDSRESQTSHFSSIVKIDLKAEWAVKGELWAIEEGTEVYLREAGIKIVENGEDFAVWLKNPKKLFKGNNKYSYNLTVSLSYPTDFKEKPAIKEDEIYFEYSLDEPINNKIDELEELYYGREESLRREAYIGGKAVADFIKNFLHSMNIK